MSDPFLAASREYEQTVAPAYELIRRARARLRDRVAGIEDDVDDAIAAFTQTADPTEPNGADHAVEAALAADPCRFCGKHHVLSCQERLIEQPGGAPAPTDADTAVDAGAARPPVSQPAARRRSPLRRARADSSEADDHRGEAGSNSRGRVADPDQSSPAASPPLTCPECERPLKSAKALGIHRSKAHGVAGRNATAAAAKGLQPRPRSTPAQRLATRDASRAQAPAPGTPRKDPREIDEDCPRGCGRHFRWEPSLLSHVSSCDGKPKE